MIALILGLITFTAAITVYGNFISGYDIETTDEYNPIHGELSQITNDTKELMETGESFAKEVQGGNVSTAGSEPEISLWRSGINVMGLFWNAFPIMWSTIELVGMRIGLPSIYTSSILIIIVVIITFAIVSAVLRQKL